MQVRVENVIILLILMFVLLASKCIVYDNITKAFKFKTQVLPCKETFRWLNNNILYHKKTKMCLNADARTTYDCYSLVNSHIKRADGLMQSVSSANCWYENKKGGVSVGKCSSAAEILFD